MTTQAEHEQSERRVALTLKFGAYVSFALLIIPVALGLAGEREAAVPMAKLGIIALLATPMLRILAALVMYIREKDIKMIWVSIALAGIVTAASVLGVLLH